MSDTPKDPRDPEVKEEVVAPAPEETKPDVEPGAATADNYGDIISC